MTIRSSDSNGNEWHWNSTLAEWELQPVYKAGAHKIWQDHLLVINHDPHALRDFPEGVSVIMRELRNGRERIAHLEKKREVIRKACPDSEWLQSILTKTYVDIPEAKIEHHMKGLKKMLRWKEFNKDNSANLIKAKEYPITDLLDFNSARKAKCIWHDDRNPSMQYYPKTNSVYCWSCQKSGDAIDVYKQIKGCTTGEAIKALS